MKLEHLALFAKLTEYDSLNQASDALFISHQALSKMIATLEETFQTKLVTRNAQGISFTEDGLYLQNKANEIATILEQTTSTLKTSYLSKTADKVLLYTNLLSNAHLIPECLPYFQNNYPSANIQIVLCENIPDDVTLFSENHLPWIDSLDKAQNSIGLFSIFSVEEPEFTLNESLQHTLISKKELFWVTKYNTSITEKTTIVLNEREINRNSHLLKFLGQHPIYFVTSQRQCYIALNSTSARTVAFDTTHYTDIYDAHLVPFSPSIYLYSYLIESSNSSDFSKFISTLLKDYFTTNINKG